MNHKSFQKKFTVVLFVYTCALLCIWIVYNGFVYVHNQNAIYDNMEVKSQRLLETIDADISEIKVGAALIGGSSYVKEFLTEKDVAAYYEKSEGISEIVAKVMGIDNPFDHVVIVNESGDFYRFVGSLSNHSITKVFNEFKNEDAAFHTLMLDGIGCFFYISPVFSTTSTYAERIGSVIIVNSLSRTRRVLEQERISGLETSVVSEDKVLLSTQTSLEGKQKSELYQSYAFFAEKQMEGSDLSVVVSATGEIYAPMHTAFISISLFIVLLFLLLIFILHRYLSKTMINPLLSTKEQMQMGLLGRQMDAHFVVNTLKNIELLIGKKETENAQTIMRDLCEILRHQQRGLCNVFLEINVLERYIAIMNIRHNKRYSVTMDINEELVNYVMPAFVLQPILENAFLHGFSKENEGFAVEVSASIMEDEMVFKISDNGAGIPKSKLEALQNALKNAHKNEYPKEGLSGVALVNIQKRIVSQYGVKYGVSVESAEGVGTTTIVTLPLLPDTTI